MEEYVKKMEDKIENNLKKFFKLNQAIKEEDEILNLSYLYKYRLYFGLYKTNKKHYSI